MKRFDNFGVKVDLYTDAKEFSNEFFEVPDSYYVVEAPNVAGCCCPEDNLISIYANPNEATFREVLGVVAHELGHLINKSYTDEEEKANLFETFAVQAYNVASLINNEILNIYM